MKKTLFASIGLIATVAFLWLFINATTTNRPDSTLTLSDSKRPHDSAIPRTPTDVSFCGDHVPLDRTDVFERLDREIILNTFSHTNTILVIKRAGRYFPVIEPILKEYGIPDDLKYLCVAESNLMPNAKSPAGAVGLWQFMESAAKDYGLRVGEEIDERFDPVLSTRAACKMLRKSYDSLGSWALVAAAYNGGLTRVRKNMEAQHQESYYDIHWAEETARYVFRIIALKEIMENPADYGYEISESDIYKPYAYKTITVCEPIPDIAQWAKENGTTFRMIRLLNPSILKTSISHLRKPVDIRIPINNTDLTAAE